MILTKNVRSTAQIIKDIEITPTIVLVRLNIHKVEESVNEDEESLGFNGFEYHEVRMRINEYLEYTKNGGDFSEFYDDLESIKNYKINQSKLLLAEWLEANPMKSSCHGGVPKYYTVTAEKQYMFTSKYTAHVSLQQASVPDVMSWNASGEPCEVWTDEECIQFISEMNNYITPLVTAQQHFEVSINACNSIEEVNQITIDYSNVHAYTGGDIISE